MLNFKGVITLLGVKENEWTNPESGQVIKFYDIVAYSNTNFKTGPKAYVYHLKPNQSLKNEIGTIKSYPKGTMISVAGLVTSVDEPSKKDPTMTWTKIGLLTSELVPAMTSQPAPKEYEKPPLPAAEVAKLEMSQFDDPTLDTIPF